jgi:hypothetical protein
MALFALYRILPTEGRIHVLFSDVRPDGRSAQHYCTLESSRLWLVREVADELRRMGFPLEFDRRTDNDAETRLFCVHRIPNGEVRSTADAVRTVCSRHGLSIRVTTYAGGELLPAPEPAAIHAPANESRSKTV